MRPNMKKIFSTFTLILVLISTPCLSLAQATATLVKPQTLPELQARIFALLDEAKFAPARWGVRIISSDGRTLIERDADKLFMPASNMKLYTTAATLDAFGPDLKFKTSVYTTGGLDKSSHLKGDVILYGRGDPNLSARFDLNAEGKPNPIDDYHGSGQDYGN